MVESGMFFFIYMPVTNLFFKKTCFFFLNKDKKKNSVFAFFDIQYLLFKKFLLVFSLQIKNKKKKYVNPFLPKTSHWIWALRTLLHAPLESLYGQQTNKKSSSIQHVKYK